MPKSFIKTMIIILKKNQTNREDNMEIDTDNELEKNYEKLYDWLKTCPLDWQEVGHPSSDLTTVNFVLVKDE